MRQIRAARSLALLASLACLAGLGSACAYRSLPQPGLCRDRTLRSKPFEGSRVVAADLEGVAFEQGSDSLWIGDDNSNQVFVIDSETGRFRARLRERDFRAAFPDVRMCDNGSPTVKCSYTAEFESLAYDPSTLSLYVVNTVNKLFLDPPVDKPAIFKLQADAKGQNLKFREWKPLETGYKYGAIAIIHGTLHVALGNEIHAYDYEANHFEGGPNGPAAYRSLAGGIVGMVPQGPYLWILSQTGQLSKVNWKTKEEEVRYDVAKLGLKSAKGLAFGEGEFFLVEGSHPNPIYVYRFATPPKFSRAGFLGGWPKSCPARE